jgi:lipopolysaccharide export LptBFGC system permease protein LptF
VKERILNYMAYIDQLLADDAGKNEEDYERIMEEHKLQLTFFMHERLVHLLVTLTFALLAFATFFALVFVFQPGLVVLFIALLVLLVPYIMHYYLLENGVQKMYRQYDEMYKRARAQSNPPQK